MVVGYNKTIPYKELTIYKTKVESFKGYVKVVQYKKKNLYIKS